MEPSSIFQKLFFTRAECPINKIKIKCSCGRQVVDEVSCPGCGKRLSIKNVYKSSEKGSDVALATHLLLDAIDDVYDVALLFSHDADFCPAVNHIVNKLGKIVIFCAFPRPKVDELRRCCSGVRKITKGVVERAAV